MLIEKIRKRTNKVGKYSSFIVIPSRWIKELLEKGYDLTNITMELHNEPIPHIKIIPSKVGSDEGSGNV